MRSGQSGDEGGETRAEFPVLQGRVVPLRGAITKRSVLYFISRLLYLEAESPHEPILMEITSPGGLVPQSADVLRIMERLSCPVNTLCRGKVRGTAVVIAAHGGRGFRAALPDCRFSLSSDAGTLGVGADESTTLPPELIEMLLRDAGKSEAQIRDWLQTGAEFSARQAQEAGLIDFIYRPPVPATALGPDPGNRA